MSIIRLPITPTSLLASIVISRCLDEMMYYHIVLSYGPRRIYAMRSIIDVLFGVNKVLVLVLVIDVIYQ